MSGAGGCARARCAAQGALALALAGCGPSQLDLGHGHWQAALAAEARGDAAAAEAARVAAVGAARASLASGESRGGQAALVLALALRRPTDATDAQALAARSAALRRTRSARLPAHLRLTRLVAHCQYSADRGWAYHAGLCWSAVLAALPSAAQYGPGELEPVRAAAATTPPAVGFGRLGRGHRAAAAEGLGNAHAARLPGWPALVAFGMTHPLWATLHQAALADPLDPDLLAVFAGRFSALCGVGPAEAAALGVGAGPRPASVSPDAGTLAGLRGAQAELLEVAIDYDDFDQHDRRCGTLAARMGAHTRPLCAHLGPDHGRPAPFTPVTTGPTCPQRSP